MLQHTGWDATLSISFVFWGLDSLAKLIKIAGSLNFLNKIFKKVSIFVQFLYLSSLKPGVHFYISKFESHSYVNK